jgi:hypothetical protein
MILKTIFIGKNWPNNRFNLTQGIVMVPADVWVQEPRQCPSQVKRMLGGLASLASLNAWIIKRIERY